MVTYIGYGFNVNEIPESVWGKFLKEKASDELENFYEYIRQDLPFPDVDIHAENEGDTVVDYIQDTYNLDMAEYLRNMINAGEADAVNGKDVVEAYDQFIVFPSIRFVDDSERAKYIKSREDFMNMIGKYLPLEYITFGNIYTGNDWEDPEYFMD